MRGSKLLSDFLTDLKFSAFRKERQWLVCCGPDIVWVVDERPDNRFRVSETTKEVLLLSIKA
jgi:tRNA(Ile)-lysidine synthase